MLVFDVLVILAIVGGFLALIINGINTARQSRAMTSVAFNQEMFTVLEPVFVDVPKRAVADSHWFVKAFMRPRRKMV